MNGLLRYCLLLLSASFLVHGLCSAANDTISRGRPIRDGESLVSAGGTFELVFFSPDEASNLRYVGIRYRDIPVPHRSVVWVANRDSPLTSRGGVLAVGEDGGLEILDGGNGNSSVWSSGTPGNDSAARLGDDGNLVLLSGGQTALWESFGDATDTFLPGMKVAVQSATGGENQMLRSWRSETDPSAGKYTMGVDPRGSPQIVIWEEGTTARRRRWRSGHWNQQIFLGLPEMTSTLLYGFQLAMGAADGSRHFSYIPVTGSDRLRFKITWDGFEEQLRWAGPKRSVWEVVQSQPDKANECEAYNFCGEFAVCESAAATCTCMPGFEPGQRGCRRRTTLGCHRNNASLDEDGDGFEAVRGVKLPDLAESLAELSGKERCEEECSRSCTCTAYAFVSGIGCMVWRGELLDVQRFPRGGQTLNVRLARSDLGEV